MCSATKQMSRATKQMSRATEHLYRATKNVEILNDVTCRRTRFERLRNLNVGARHTATFSGPKSTLISKPVLV